VGLKKYIPTMLTNFESIKEWADIIQWLDKVIRVDP
jgi:hypothetical protein